MRTALYSYILLFVVASLAGCARSMLVDNPPAEQVTSRSGEHVSDDSVHEVKSERDLNTENPCAGTSGNFCGGAAGTGEESETGSPVPYASDSAEPTPDLDNYKNSESGGFSYTGETITEDTEWRGNVTIHGSLTIAPQATVTIDPGTVVEFRRSSSMRNSAVLLVHGRLAARGTEDQPVQFRAATGDVPAGRWRGIMFLASDKKNVMEHCRVEGAETGVDAEYSNVAVKNSRFYGCRTALRAENSVVYIRGSKADKCGLGIGLYDSEAELVSVTLDSNLTGIYSERSSVYLSGSNLSGNEHKAFSAGDSKVKIVKNTFARNGSGLSLSSCEGSVSENGIVENRDYGISISGSMVKVNANDISRNEGIGVRVGDGKSIAWGNVISSNGRYDLYNAGSEDYRAIGNWWGEGMSTDSPGKIYDKSVDGKNGRVIYFPALRNKPDTAP
jgi:predicted small lipoprotein YifL